MLSDLTTTSSYISSYTSTFSKTLFAFYILSLTGSSITVLSSFLSIFLTTSKPLIYTSLFFSLLGAVFQLAASIVATIMISLVVSVINSFGKSIGVSASRGVRFLALTWVGFGVMLVVSWFWCVVWFVEVRGVAFKARRRTVYERGNWRGILREVRGDLKVE
jgi:hypothetical protein